MPALGMTIDEETVAADFATMDQGEFARAYLNRWAPKGVPVFAFGQWLACLDDASKAQGSIAFAIDVAPDRSTASIAAAGGRADGRIHVELVDRRDGTDWVVSRMGELVERWRPVACDRSRSSGRLAVPGCRWRACRSCSPSASTGSRAACSPALWRPTASPTAASRRSTTP
jgi:hypothetical protein